MIENSASDDREIVVELTADGEKPERVSFKASEVLSHHGEGRTWDELLNDPHQYLQMSLAEDYALYAFKRRFGDMGVYEVNVIAGLGGPVSGLDESYFRVWADGTVQSSEDGDPYSWMSDDFQRIPAANADDALAIAQATWSGRPHRSPGNTG